MTHHYEPFASPEYHETRNEAIAALAEIKSNEEQSKHDADTAPTPAEQRQADEYQDRQVADQRQQVRAHLQERARAGDYQASLALDQLRTLDTGAAQGRQAVLQELGRDINTAIDSLDVPDDARRRLRSAPSMADFTRELRGLPIAQQRRMAKTIADYARETKRELGDPGPVWR